MQRFRLLKQSRQTTEYSCGACALQKVMSYWGKEVDEAALMEMLGTTPEDGTWPEAIVRVAREQGLEAELRSELTLDEVQRTTAEGHPVIVLGQVWRTQKARDATFADEWDSGHWFIVLGIDADYVYFEDPYMRMGRGFVPRATFEEAWHNVMGGDRSRPVQSRMGIFIRGERPAAAPDRRIGIEQLDFSRFGSLNLIVTRFRGNPLPYDFVSALADIFQGGLLRPDAFVFLYREKGGGLIAIGGGRLEDECEIAGVNAMLGALAGMREGGRELARTRAHAAVQAAALGDFGLSEQELMRIGEDLPPDHSAIIVLIENLWERRIRDVAATFDGHIASQRMIPAARLVELGEELRRGSTATE